MAKTVALNSTENVCREIATTWPACLGVPYHAESTLSSAQVLKCLSVDGAPQREREHGRRSAMGGRSPQTFQSRTHSQLVASRSPPEDTKKKISSFGPSPLKSGVGRRPVRTIDMDGSRRCGHLPSCTQHLSPARPRSRGHQPSTRARRCTPTSIGFAKPLAARFAHRPRCQLTPPTLATGD